MNTTFTVMNFSPNTTKKMFRTYLLIFSLLIQLLRIIPPTSLLNTLEKNNYQLQSINTFSNSTHCNTIFLACQKSDKDEKLMFRCLYQLCSFFPHNNWWIRDLWTFSVGEIFYNSQFYFYLNLKEGAGSVLF